MLNRLCPGFCLFPQRSVIGTLCLVILLCFPSLINAQVAVKELVCEYKTNPIGIDSPQPRLSWKLSSTKQNVLQTAYQIRVADAAEKLKNSKGLIWDSGKIGSGKSIHIPYQGSALPSGKRVYWQVMVWDNFNNKSKWSEVAYWEMGLLKESDWKASFISADIAEDLTKAGPSPFLRKEFNVTKPVVSARVYVTSLGLYDLELNGKKVGDELFTPGWTSYNKRLQYQVYDVKEQIAEGANAFGAILGDGWYRGHIGWGENNRNRYGEKLALLLQLELNYQDGSKEFVLSDASWKAKTGPILFSDIYNGETFDGRRSDKNWSTATFDDAGWKNVKILDHTKNTLIASQGDPVKRIQEIKPVKFFTTPKGEKVFDLGQNIVGWARLKVNGKQGDKVTITFAEVLDKEGNFYTDNLRGAKTTDVYILRGEGEEIYEPHFTFHGFRYVRVDGFPGELTKDNITGIVIHSAIKPTGTFECSDPLINQLQSNIQWGQKGNFLDVPTDCPQRDERLGWTGDAQAFSPTASFNFNVASFFTKWLKDLAADQLKNGAVPDVVPDILNFHGEPGLGNKKEGWAASTGWADAAIVIPWTMYLSYGDERILEEQYPSMKAWVEYMRKRAGDKYLWTGDKHYGDWLSFNSTDSDYPGAYTEKDLIASAYFAYSSRLLAQIATILKKSDDAATYNALFGKIRDQFVKEYVTTTGRLVSNTQTAYSLALAFDLLPPEMEAKAAQYLKDDVIKFGHITTGFLGTPLICKVLTETGHIDEAYFLLNRKQYPSWLYPVTAGATTIWERWDAQRPDGSFQDTGMNSFNHYAYGAIGEWLYTVVAGVNTDVNHPGYKNIIFKPQPGGRLTHAKATIETVYGKVASAWQIKDNEFIYTIEVPSNTTAVVILPETDMESVHSGKNMLADLKTVSSISKVGNDLQFSTGSGTYEFRYPVKAGK
jgi:alpha-L-rhamnosidase